MSAPHADDRTPAHPEGRRNGHPTTLLTGAAPTDGDPAPDSAAPDSAAPDGAAPDGPAPDTAAPGTGAPGPVPAPRAADGAAGTPPEPAPEPTELTGPVDVRNRPGPRTPPMPWPAVPGEQRPVAGVPAQRSGPGGDAAARGDRPGHDRAGPPAGEGMPGGAPHAGPGAGPRATPPGAGPHRGHTSGPGSAPPAASTAGRHATPGGRPAAHPGARPATGPHAPWTAVPQTGRACSPTAPWAAPVPGGPVRGGPRAAAPVPVVYPPGHAGSGAPAGRWDALRDRLSAARLPDGGLRGAVPHRAAAIAVAATLVLAAAVVAAAYAGSGRTGEPGAPQGSGAGTAPVAAPVDLVAGTTAADPAAFGSPVSFTSPTGNISCRITGGAGDGAVRCDVTSRTWSAGDCPDAALVAGGPAGARTECGGTPVGSGAAVLDYGTHLTEGDVTCVSSRTGVECRDARTGAGFTAARAAYRLY